MHGSRPRFSICSTSLSFQDGPVLQPPAKAGALLRGGGADAGLPAAGAFPDGTEADKKKAAVLAAIGQGASPPRVKGAGP